MASISNSRGVMEMRFICSSQTESQSVCGALPEPSRTFAPLPSSQQPNPTAQPHSPDPSTSHPPRPRSSNGHLDPIPNNADITARFSPVSVRIIPSKPADLTLVEHSAPRSPLESPLNTQGNIPDTKPCCCPSVECYPKHDQALRHFSNITEEQKATNLGDQLTSKPSSGPLLGPQSERKADSRRFCVSTTKRCYKPSSSSSNPTFRCTFTFAGCTSSFTDKSKWKRHVAIQHMCFIYWRCQESWCSSLEQGGRFNRKDLFTQHLRRMHSSEADHDVQKQDSWLAMHLERGRRTGNALIEEVRCPVPECGESWKGKTAWDKRMDHVGVHWEKVAKGTEEGGWDESGGGLLEWAVEERVVTAAAGAIGWRLVCAKTFRRADDMEVHLKTHGELMLPAGNRQLAPTGLNDDDVPDVRKRKECPVCGTAFISASLKYHMDHKVCERDKSKEFRCDFCEKGFETPTSLIRHRQKNNACELQYRPNLTPDLFTKMNADLEMEELRFESALAKALLSLPSTDRDAQIKRLKTNNSLQKSGIRRLYGVQVRHSKLATPNAVLTGGKLRDRNIPI